MNRQHKRKMKRLLEKYPEEINLLVHEKFKFMIEKLFEKIAETIYNILRNNRVGEERANRITDEIIETLARELSK